MAQHADIVIHGGGIAGLWALHALKKQGHDAVLLEKEALGAGQTLASQGIIHSGLKYLLAGKVSPLARQISAMPNVWREHLKTDLSDARIAAASQIMLIPKGFAGAIVKAVAANALGTHASETSLPAEIAGAGFAGSAIALNEPVVDVGSILHAFAALHGDNIRKTGETIEGKIHIHTAAGGNAAPGVEMQRRPLLMGLVKNAPFPLFAHFVELSDKPLATITTHKTRDGALVWYVGGQVAEREKSDDPRKLFTAIKSAFAKYLPDLDTGKFEWASFPVDRVEGKTESGALPDLPVIVEKGNHLYCWPTKLAFAPLLGDMIVKKLEEKNIAPSERQADWSFLPPVDHAVAPWDKVTWTKDI